MCHRADRYRSAPSRPITARWPSVSKTMSATSSRPSKPCSRAIERSSASGHEAVDGCPREAKERHGPLHDVVGEELRAAVEQLGQRHLAVLGVELILLLDRDPRELEP